MRKGQKASAETRAKISAAMTGKTKSAEHVAKVSEARRGVPIPSLQGKPLSEEHRAKLSQAHRGKVLTPEHRAKIAASLTSLDRTDAPRRHYGLGRDVAASIRARDGDLCQLCLTPIDFTLPSRTRWSASIDHRIPTLAGGTDDPENLWLAHSVCNSKKGARYCGRLDGTTDVRR